MLLFGAHQRTANVIGHVEPFMQIECQRVRALHAPQRGTQSGRQSGQSSEGAVHVKPQRLLAAEICEGGEIVDSAGIDRSCIANDANWTFALLPVGGNCTAQFVKSNAIIVVNPYLQLSIGPQSENLDGSFYTLVRF